MPRFTAYSLPPPPSFFSPSVRSLFSATQGRGGGGRFRIRFRSVVSRICCYSTRIFTVRIGTVSFPPPTKNRPPLLFPPSIHGRHIEISVRFCTLSVSQIVAREWHESRGGREVFLPRGRVEFSPIIRAVASINFIGRGWMNWKARGVNCVQGEG